MVFGVGAMKTILFSPAAARCVTKVRDGIPCGSIERSSTLHPVPPYRSSNLTDWRDPHNGSTPVPPPATRSGRPHPLGYGRSTAFSVSLEGITETEAAGIQKFCTTNRYCAHAHGYGAIYCTSATNDSLKKQ